MEVTMKKWYTDYGLQARMLLTMFLLAVLYLIFLAVILVYGEGWTNILLFFMMIMLFAQFFFSDKLVLWSTGGRVVTEQEEPRLHEPVSRLCAIADLPKPKIASVESNVPNAFATGRSKDSAVVAVTTSLKQKLSQPELEAVLAHELSLIHISEPTRLGMISYAVFCLKKKKKNIQIKKKIKKK